MGACESSNADGKRKARGRGEGISNAKRTATKMPKLAKADLDSSRQVEEEEIDQRVEILRRGQKKELQKMIDNYEDDINDYSFGTNKTLLLEAVINCPNPAVIDMIMEKGADIDKEEYQTGNTAIFLSALDLKVDFVAHTVLIKNKEISLTPKEFDLLKYFIENEGVAISREILLNKIWGYDFFGDDRTIDTHIKMLRNNLGKYRNLIKTVRAVGYKFEIK